jgi:hypothetical protein
MIKWADIGHLHAIRHHFPTIRPAPRQMPRDQEPRRRALGMVDDEVSLFPRRKAGQAERKAKKGEARPVSFDRKSIEALFGKPQAEAAHELGIALTTLKHLCRSMGIERWPYQRWPQPVRNRPPAARSCDDDEADHHAASEAPTRNYSRSESSNSFDGTASNSTASNSSDSYRQGTDTAPTRSMLPSRPELAHGFTDPGPRSEQTQYAGSGGWLDNIPPGRPDGIWQIHADWLKPGEELATEPEFDAILAHLAATPMP